MSINGFLNFSSPDLQHKTSQILETITEQTLLSTVEVWRTKNYSKSMIYILKAFYINHQNQHTVKDVKNFNFLELFMHNLAQLPWRDMILIWMETKYKWMCLQPDYNGVHSRCLTSETDG